MPWRLPPLPPRPRPATPAPGYTFAEVLVAVGILTVAFLGMISVFVTSHANVSDSGRDTTAAAIAQSLAENLRNQPQLELASYNNMTTDDPDLCPGLPGSRMNGVCLDWIAQMAQLPGGRGTVTVTPVRNPLTGLNLHRITITVTWTEAGRGGRQLALIAGRSD